MDQLKIVQNVKYSVILVRTHKTNVYNVKDKIENHKLKIVNVKIITIILKI